MKSKSKFHKKPIPKFSGGGFLNAFGQGANMMGGTMQEKQDPEALSYMSQYNPEVLKQQQTSNQAGAAVENVVGSMGPWGAAIAGVSKIAGKAFGPDQYGDYKDNAGGKAKQFFNRSLNIKEGVAGLMDTFKRPTADNIKSQLTLGLWGKSEREKDAEKIKHDMEIRNNSALMSQNASAGAIVANSLPRFSAPAYGKHGMKFPPDLFPPVTHASSTTRVAKPARIPQEAKPMDEKMARNLLHMRSKLSNEPQPWMQADRQWLGGDTGLAPGHHLYINDAGNLQKKPYYNQLKRKSKFYRP